MEIFLTSHYLLVVSSNIEKEKCRHSKSVNYDVR